MPREIKFYRVSEEYGFLGNFPDYEIEIDGQKATSTERWFQAKKFEGTEHELQVMNAPSSRQSADWGRERNRPLRKDWDLPVSLANVPGWDKLSAKWSKYVGADRPMLTKDYIMLRAVRAKFFQHKMLGDKLLATGDAILIEHTTNDKYWADAGDGTGPNMLGKILMIVRDELQEAREQQDIDEAGRDCGC